MTAPRRSDGLYVGDEVEKLCRTMLITGLVVGSALMGLLWFLVEHLTIGWQS